MIVNQLLDELEDRAIELKIDGDRIRYRPKSSMTPELLEQVKVHKPELLSILNANDHVVDKAYHKAIDRLQHEDYFSEQNAFLEQCRGAFTSIISEGQQVVCDRCGSNDFVDVSIHEGRSTRRDCAKCDKFIEFPTWKN